MNRAERWRRNIDSMANQTIDELFACVSDATISGDRQTVVSSIEYDSRRVEPGGLFVALRGGYADGHAFLAQARKRLALIHI